MSSSSSSSVNHSSTHHSSHVTYLGDEEPRKMSITISRFRASITRWRKRRQVSHEYDKMLREKYRKRIPISMTPIGAAY